MLIDGFFLWLAQGPFFLFAVVIGAVVSMDVAVVEITRDYEFKERNRNSILGWWTSRMKTMAVLHAGFHSLSFLIYMVAIYLFQFLALWPIDFFDLPPDLALGLLALINFVVISFIWWTYRSKIKEDHSEKSNDSDVIDRSDMKLFVDFVRMLSHKYGFSDRIRGVAVAGSVAVDMLAVSALLKGVLLPNGSIPPTASFSGVLFLDLFLFAVTIFFVVFAFVVLAQFAGTAAREWHNMVVALRVLEPVAVFFILAGVVRLTAELIRGASLSSGYSEYSNSIDLLFALLVTISLFWSNGINLKQLNTLYARRSVDAESANPTISGNELARVLNRFTPALKVLLAVFLVVFASMWIGYSTDPGRHTHNHLAEATGYIAGFVLLTSIYVLYWPSKSLDNWEINESSNFREGLSAEPNQFWHRLGATGLAFISLNVYNFLVIGRSLETEAILLWSVYVIFSWVLFDLRRWRFSLSDQPGDSRRENDADYAELITAVGLASSAIVFIVLSTWYLFAH